MLGSTTAFVLGHFLGHGTTARSKVGKVDDDRSRAKVWSHKDTKPSKVESVSS